MNTKKILIIILATLAMVSATAQNSRKVVKQNRAVSEFTAINASGGWDVIVRQGNRQSVSIEVSEGMLDRAVIEVKNGTLHIYNKSRNQPFSWKNLRNMRNVTQKAYVTVTDLKEITVSGGVDIVFKTPLKTNDFSIKMSGGTDLEKLTLSCNNFTGNFSSGSDAEIRFLTAQNIKVTASGGSDVNLFDIDTRHSQITASGGSDVNLTGKTEEFIVSASGGCDLSASRFQARDCTADVSGAVDASIRVTDRLNINVSGASDVVCYGNPHNVEKSLNRSSSLTMR